MSERVRSLGGELEVWSDIEKGTIVRAEIPLPQGAAEVHEVTV
jgi:signal transduction histidine kinase